MPLFNKRQKAIATLIGKHAVSKQEELTDLLKSEFKIEATQTVVSRDLKTMGCVKTIRNNKRVYSLPYRNTQQEILYLAVKNILSNETTIVIHTGPGLAPFVGDTIDQHGLDIIGTVAGENVVFIAPTSIHKIDEIVAELKDLVGWEEASTHE